MDDRDFIDAMQTEIDELETKEIGLIAGMKEQAEQIAELKKQLNWKALAVSRETYNAIAKQAIREMLEATKEYMVLKNVDGEGYLSTRVIKTHADNLEKG